MSHRIDKCFGEISAATVLHLFQDPMRRVLVVGNKTKQKKNKPGN